MSNVSRDLIVEHMWLQNNATRVEITELDSDDRKLSSNSEKDYTNDIRNNEDENSVSEADIYEENHKAREKRRMKNGNCAQTYSPDFMDDFNDIFTDFVYSSIYKTKKLTQRKRIKNKETNCFTILNKSFSDSGSSTDDLKVTEYTDIQHYYDSTDTDESNNDEIINVDRDIVDKKTVWIYSFKNKPVLSEYNTELVNVPYETSSSSTSEESEAIRDISAWRVSSPVPNVYIPRLNLLCPTLPTVTEITEPVTTLRNKIEGQQHSNGNRKVNGWVEESTTPTNNDKSSTTNVINWMCLSPRDRKRRSNHTYSNKKHVFNLPVVIETPPGEQSLEHTSNKQLFNKITTIAEINTVEKSNGFNDIEIMCENKDDILLMDIDNESFCNKEIDNAILRKPHIRLPKKNAISTNISAPIEKLDTNSWISDDKKQNKQDLSPLKDIETVLTDHCDEQMSKIQNIDCAGNRLWRRNMSLLKPSEWHQFREITDSIPSLQLSIDTEYKKRSWLNRIAKCFKCFK